MSDASAESLRITTLGPCGVPSPLARRNLPFVDESRRIVAHCDTETIRRHLASGGDLPSFEPAGPRSPIFFDPGSIGCGIVTCGGLCPGLNDVIRSIVLSLHFAYGVERIFGFRYGYAGLAANCRHDPIALTPEAVDTLQQQGGTLLGSSRGPQDLGEMVDTLERLGIQVLFTIGGDGTLRGASALAREIDRRGLSIAVVGIPKTIDNDLLWMWRTFGYGTAVEAATTSLVAAHSEARGAVNGIGLVKLMGRHSGFIAAEATLANSDVNFCLVPEVPFTFDGRGGFLDVLEQRLGARGHAVIVVAEGAGQEVLQDPDIRERDVSGNLRLKDIGVFLREKIESHFAKRGTEMTIKYIDPSYAIRSVPANALDSAYCLALGQHAVHAAMAGKTDMVVGYWNQSFTHVPIGAAVAGRKTIDPRGIMWQRILEATGQPPSMVGSHFPTEPDPDEKRARRSGAE